METTEVNEWGSIHISQQVIAAIASLTAAKVPSVAALGTNIADAAAEKLGRTRPNHGVDVSIDGKVIELTVRLLIRYGCRIPDVAWKSKRRSKTPLKKRRPALLRPFTSSSSKWFLRRPVKMDDNQDFAYAVSDKACATLLKQRPRISKVSGPLQSAVFP